MNPRNVAILLCVVCSVYLFADQTAFTNDGKRVLLKDDGTWQLIEQDKTVSESFDFRKTSWGMTKDQVKNSEPSSPIRDDANALFFKGKISNLDCVYAFVFAKGKLVRSKYAITEEHTNKNDYIDDYNSLKAALTGKYGDPLNDRTNWKNSLYRDDKEEWGFAVSLGHLSYFATWSTPTTEVFLGLLGDNYKVDLVIEYSSIALAGLEELEQKESSQSDL